MALNGLFCADVPLRIYSLTQSSFMTDRSMGFYDLGYHFRPRRIFSTPDAASAVSRGVNNAQSSKLITNAGNIHRRRMTIDFARVSG